MLLLHFPLCCLSISVDYCRKVKRVIEIKVIKENATNRDHYPIVLVKKFCSLTHRRPRKSVMQVTRGSYLFTSPRAARLELAGFFISIKAYCASFIYINITTED